MCIFSSAAEQTQKYLNYNDFTENFSAYKTMCTMMETLYLPAFMESPEYLGRVGVPPADFVPK